MQHKGKALFQLVGISAAVLALVACGGGDPQDLASPVGAPHAVVKAGKPTGAAAVAVHLYQALFGKAPGYALMTDYTVQATADAAAFASSLASAFASTSHADLAKLVLDNLGVTATTVPAVNSKGQSEYTLLLDAVQQIFAAFPTMRGQVILNMTNLLEGLEADATYGAAAAVYNTQAAANQTYATNPANTSAAAVTLGGSGSGGTSTTSPALLGGTMQGVALNLTATVSTFAGSVNSPVGTAPKDGVGVAATFGAPVDMTTDGSNLYVADGMLIRKIGIATGAVTTLVGNPTAAMTCPRDGSGVAAEFCKTRGITTDGANLYVTESQRIRKVVIATGVVTTLAGSNVQNSVDGTGTAATFNMPMGITTDGTNLYVVDSAGYKIRKIVIATGVVTTLAGNGTNGPVDGIGLAAGFWAPRYITTDGSNLYVTEVNAIRKIELATGTVTTLAGGRSGTLSNDGVGLAANFSGLYGITTDGTNLYVAEGTSNKIRKVVIGTGVVTTMAGGGTSGKVVDGTGTAASFVAPGGIVSDGKNLFVSETGSWKIRKIQ